MVRTSGAVGLMFIATAPSPESGSVLSVLQSWQVTMAIIAFPKAPGKYLKHLKWAVPLIMKNINVSPSVPYWQCV